jgi:23S rRNA pseudouridine1911/1915/1917 synthase
LRQSISEVTGTTQTAPVGEEFQTHALELPHALSGLRLDQALARALPQYSRARIQSWIEQGLVEVEGRPPRGRDKVVGGEHVLLRARFPRDERVLAEALPLEFAYQDEALLVILKPAGLVVHPGAGNRSPTLQNALLAYDPRLARVPRAGLVHRLDKDTSGLLIVARTPEVHTLMVEAMQAREIHREYLALCVGVMSGGGTIDEPIGRHRSQRIKMAVRSDGRAAVTHYRIERRFAAHTLVRVELETGRTHQIRVHLAHIGFPVVGDPVYGGRRQTPRGASEAVLAALHGFRRQALHATRLRFAHPLSGAALELEAPLPADFRALLEALSE